MPTTEYLTNSDDLKTVADAIRGKTGGTDNLTYPSGFATAIAGIAADCNATAGDVRNGKTAYVGNAKITGNMTEKAAATYDVSSSDQTISANQYLTGAQTIRRVVTSNIAAGNIKKGVVVKVGDAADDDRITAVTGTYTSDANASDQTISSGRYLSGNQTIRKVTTTNLSAANIKKGVTVQVGDSGSATRIANVTGTCVPCTTYMPVSGDCFMPFMFKVAGGTIGSFSWNGSVFIFEGAGSVAHSFIVPCNIKMTYYPNDTSALTTITFSAGTWYTLGAYTNTVAYINTPSGTIHVWRVTKWEVV